MVERLKEQITVSRVMLLLIMGLLAVNGYFLRSFHQEIRDEFKAIDTRFCTLEGRFKDFVPRSELETSLKASREKFEQLLFDVREIRKSIADTNTYLRDHSAKWESPPRGRYWPGIDPNNHPQ